MYNIRLKSGKWLRMPEKIDEMDQRQYVAFAGLLYRLDTGNIDVEMFKLLLIIDILDIKITGKYKLFTNNKTRELIDSNISVLTGLLDVLFKDETNEGRLLKSIELRFESNKLTRYKQLQGPGNALEDMNFEEFTQALIYNSQFMKTRSIDDLNRLIAVLYRPRKRFLFVRKRLTWYTYKERAVFNARKIEVMSVSMAKTDIGFRYGAFIWFNNAIDRLRVCKFSLGGSDIDFAPLFNPEDKSESGIGMLGVLFDLAESGLFGTTKETGEQNLYDVLIRLYQLMKRADSLKKKTHNVAN